MQLSSLACGGAKFAYLWMLQIKAADTHIPYEVSENER